MRPRFQADAGLNQKIVLGLRRREPSVDFAEARAAGVIRKTMAAHFARFLDSRSSPGLIIVPQALDIGLAIEDLLIVWAASDAEEWTDKVGFRPL